MSDESKRVKERADAIEACIALCYAHGEINAAEALESNMVIISHLPCADHIERSAQK